MAIKAIRIKKGGGLFFSLCRKGIICGFFLTFIFLHSAFAVTPPYLDKPKIRLSILPGQTASGDIIMENSGLQGRPMQLYLEDWYYISGGDGSKKFVAANTTPHSCASWITFAPAKFTLPAYGRQRIGYSVKVPPQAQGGYYAVLFFETGLGETRPSEGATIDASLSLAMRIGALFYVEVKGTIKRAADIENLSLKRDKVGAPLLVEMDFRNSGNVDITAGGSFHIMDKKGLVYARNEFNNVYTFPADVAKFTSTWKEPIPKGEYDLVLTIDMGKAQEEVGLSRGPIMVKEAEIEMGDNGEVIKVGELK